MEIDPKLIAGVSAWLWKEFGKDVIKIGAGSLWTHFRFNEAKQRYQKKVKKLYSNTRVLYKLESVPLDNYYVDLSVLQEPEAYRRYGVDYLESNFDERVGFYSRGDRTEALLVVNEYDRLFVLGKPGAGKTTFLKYLASLAAGEKEIDKVPIFISFNSWGYSKKNLFDFIVEQFDVCGFPNADKFIELLLEKGKALILFDGLDEVGMEGDQRGQMIYELENLFRQYQDNKFIITCRNAANDYKFEGFTYVEIADLTDYQVRTFAEKWFSSNLDKAKKFQTDLAKEEHQNLKELSRNPLLLGMLCLVFEETSHFPPKRGMVYREAIDALMKRWDKDRGVEREKLPGFSPSFEKKFLSFLAYGYLLDNKIFFDQNDILKKIEKGFPTVEPVAAESEDVLNAIEVQHGLLVQRAMRVYTFSHLTFQEYFAAQYIIDHINLDQNILVNLFGHLYNLRWREVFPLVASLISTPDIFFKIFLARIREPVKKNKLLNSIIKELDKYFIELQGNGDIITARMRAVALTISISKIVYLIQDLARNRASHISKKMLQTLKLDESHISLEKASGMAEIVIRGSAHERGNRDKIDKLLMLAFKKYRQTVDDDIEDSSQLSSINLDTIRISLRDQLRATDEELTEQIVDNIQYKLEESLFIGSALQIVLDFKPTFVNEFIQNIKEFDFPKTFAHQEEWFEFKEKLIRSVVPSFDPKILELKEEHLADLEKFLRGNIFILDCLRQSGVSAYNYSDYVFSMKPFKSL